MTNFEKQKHAHAPTLVCLIDGFVLSIENSLIVMFVDRSYYKIVVKSIITVNDCCISAHTSYGSVRTIVFSLLTFKRLERMLSIGTRNKF